MLVQLVDTHIQICSINRSKGSLFRNPLDLLLVETSKTHRMVSSVNLIFFWWNIINLYYAIPYPKRQTLKKLWTKAQDDPLYLLKRQGPSPFHLPRPSTSSNCSPWNLQQEWRQQDAKSMRDVNDSFFGLFRSSPGNIRVWRFRTGPDFYLNIAVGEFFSFLLQRRGEVLPKLRVRMNGLVLGLLFLLWYSFKFIDYFQSNFPDRRKELLETG